MIQSVKELNNIFEEIDSKTNFRVTAYLIGGGALMQHGLKGLTKDVDLVVKSKKEYYSLEKVLKLINYKETTLTKGINRLTISAALEKKDSRIDLFLEKICGKMSFSKSMVLRSKILFKGKNFSVYVAAIEDIFVFKTITEREGDKSDCESIIKQSPNWSVILKEVNNQAKKGEKVWLTYINERLLEFESKGYAIPIIKQLEKEVEEYYESLEKKFLKNS